MNDYLFQRRLVRMLESTLDVLPEGCLHWNAMFLGGSVTVIHSVHSTMTVVQTLHNLMVHVIENLNRCFVYIYHGM